MIRPAALHDIPAILRLAERMWAEAPAFRGLKLDVFRADAVFARLIERGTLLLAQSEPPEAELVGFMLFAVGPDIWTGVTCASEMALYVVPEARRAGHAAGLVEAAEAHSARQGARWMTAGTSLGGGPGGGSLYREAGFAPMGETFRKGLVPAAVGA